MVKQIDMLFKKKFTNLIYLFFVLIFVIEAQHWNNEEGKCLFLFFYYKNKKIILIIFVLKLY